MINQTFFIYKLCLKAYIFTDKNDQLNVSRGSAMSSNNFYNILRWWFSKFFFHHKWNKAWLLVKNWYIWVASQVGNQLQTLDLRKLGNIRKTLKLHRIIAKCPNSQIEGFIRTSKKNCWVSLIEPLAIHNLWK